MMMEQRECFVVMPISDTAGYAIGHFNRVYEFVIIPACEKAGYRPFRADQASKTNHIVIDILRRLIKAEMVLCDLSSRNPNVLYELGIRQAFNKPVVLIKDDITDRIFDIQGLRYSEYDSTLRVDSTQSAISQIAKAIEETRDSQHDDVNSLIQLLEIVPATLTEGRKLSDEATLILEAIAALSVRMSSLEDISKYRKRERQDRDSERIRKLTERLWLLNTQEAEEEIRVLEKARRQIFDEGEHRNKGEDSETDENEE